MVRGKFEANFRNLLSNDMVTDDSKSLGLGYVLATWRLSRDLEINPQSVEIVTEEILNFVNIAYIIQVIYKNWSVVKVDQILTVSW